MKHTILVLLFCYSAQTRIAAELSENSSSPSTTTNFFRQGSPFSIFPAAVRPTTWNLPPGAITLSTGTYLVNTQWLNWTSARQHCQTMGMDLLAIETQEENEVVANHAANELRGWLAWTSGCYSRGEDAVIWRSTGRKLTYTNWRSRDNHGNLKDETMCVRLEPDEKTWLQFSISYVNPSICERN